jgi:hypothetical protein
LMCADLGARTIRKIVDGAHRGHDLPSVGERVARADASAGVGARPSAGRQS